MNTYRFGPHSKGDDTRSEAYLAEIKSVRDPILIHGKRLEAEERWMIEQEVTQEVDTAYQHALQDPFPSVESFSM